MIIVSLSCSEASCCFAVEGVTGEYKYTYFLIHAVLHSLASFPVSSSPPRNLFFIRPLAHSGVTARLEPARVQVSPLRTRRRESESRRPPPPALLFACVPPRPPLHAYPHTHAAAPHPFAAHGYHAPDSRTSVTTLTNNQCHNLTVLLNIFGGDMNIFKQMSRCIAIMAGACFGASQYARASGRTKICTFQRRHQIRLNTRPKPRWRWRCVHSLW